MTFEVFQQRLTAQSTLGKWIDHPVGGPHILALLDRQGQDPSLLGPARKFPLNQLVALSQGSISPSDVDDLVRAANGEKPVTEEEVTPTTSDAELTPIVSGLSLDDIQIRDGFILNDSANATYYLYGSTDKNIWYRPCTGFDTYRSSDLQQWDGPFEAFRPPEDFWSPGQYWAPEVHPYQGRWFMFATFTGTDGRRGTQVLAADAPEGPFTPWSNCPVTPRKWRCLDGTLFIDDEGDPWIVFCHEWTQVHDGGVVAQRLTSDLREATGNPIYLFNASDAPWAKLMQGSPFDDYKLPIYVTDDGCFLFRLASGHLIMLWSSFGEQGYAMGIAHSQSGLITGPWIQEQSPVWATDGGHGMIVRLADSRLVIALHQPNGTPNERAVLRYLQEHESTVALISIEAQTEKPEV